MIRSIARAHEIRLPARKDAVFYSVRANQSGSGMAIAVFGDMNLSVLSQIKIVEVDRIIPFEWNDTDSEQSRDDFEFLPELIRHPLPVLKLNHTEYLLLEETSQFHR